MNQLIIDTGLLSEYYKSLVNLPDSELIRMAAEIMEDEA